jgi:3-oxoacyl-[acyl-carrier-protein] synthase II
MSSPSRRVVVTGLGVLTPVGLDAAAFWDGLSHGRSGIRPIAAFNAAALPTRFAGEVVGFEAKKYLAKEARKNLRVMARAIQLAVAGAQVALDDAKVDKAKLDPTRFGVEFGAGLLPSELHELGPAAQASAAGDGLHIDLKRWGEQGLPAIQPLWMLKYLPNMLACHVSILHDAQGPNNSITEGDVASLLALGEAVRIIRRDQADFFLAGGADSKINPLSMVRQCMFEHLSKRNDAPEKASRPFDLGRDGIVIGEGAGVLVVEEHEHARRRGARIDAEIAGFGSAFDRGLTGRGMARAIRVALRQAGITPADVDHVNAHGLGSPRLDAAEAAGLADVFGPRGVPVVAVKSSIGNLSAGAGTTELAASILALRHGTLPGTLNFDQPDPACPVDVSKEPRPVRKPYFVKLGFTDMGQCAAVVCRKWE